MKEERILKVILSLLILTSCSTRYTITNKQQCKCILKYEYEMINKQDTITMQSNKLYNVGDKMKTPVQESYLKSVSYSKLYYDGKKGVGGF